MFAVADCNNFYVSCERVFQPELRDRPVIILSNNDGCVIARSEEAKRMGIKMGVPFYQVKALVETRGVKVRSSNLVLYEDMSRRVMAVIRERIPRVEQYSIDECFMEVSTLGSPERILHELRKDVLQQTGIPVSIGVAPTKTLAKMASHFAKHYSGYRGVCFIDSEKKRFKALKLMPIDDVWGVGRRSAARLVSMGVKTAFDLTQWREAKVRNELHLPGVQMWRELRGEASFQLQTPSRKQSLTTSRTFHDSISDFTVLSERIADFASLCSERLRKDGTAARGVLVYLSTNKFRCDQPQYSNAARLTLDVATSDVRELVAAAGRALRAIYRPGYAYKRAGVVLTGIEAEAVQFHLFDQVDRKKQAQLLAVIDHIKATEGHEALRVASQSEHLHHLCREHLSPRYTTCLQEIVRVGSRDKELFASNEEEH